MLVSMLVLMLVVLMLVLILVVDVGGVMGSGPFLIKGVMGGGPKVGGVGGVAGTIESDPQ